MPQPKSEASLALDKTVIEQFGFHKNDTDFSDFRVFNEDNLTVEASKDTAPSRARVLAKLGFRFGKNGTHATRTMMFDELTLLLDCLPTEATCPFMKAEILRHNKKPKLNISWDKDRGKDVTSAPWFHKFDGERINDHHLTLAEKFAAKKQGI